MSLDLADAFTRIEHAKNQHDDLMAIYTAWVQAKHVDVITERDSDFVRYIFGVALHEQPAKSLAVMAGEIFNNIRTALDYVAWQIYTAAGGELGDRGYRNVQFPITEDQAAFDKVVPHQVPDAWPEARAALIASQPYSQLGEFKTAQLALRGLGASDKHHHLALVAAAATMAEAARPDNLPDDCGLLVGMVRPGPVLQLGKAMEVGRASVHKDSCANPYDDAVPWSSGIRLDQPAPPSVQIGFRASDGSHTDVFSIKPLIDHVEEVVRRFAGIAAPP
jgi:hypothetical protein